MKPFFIPWLMIVFVSTVFAGLVYVAVQQTIRHGANDPQIQMAEDGAVHLKNGAQTVPLVGMGQIDISHSLSPITTIYDESGKVVATNAVLHGAVPELANGVLPDTKQKGETRFTWQPETGTRLATVIVHYTGKNSGYILVARNMREIEMRESQAMTEATAAWAVAVIGSFILGLFASILYPSKK